MSDLTDFLLQRIAEDEAVARAVLESGDPLPPWTPGDFADTDAWGLGAADGPSGYTSVIVDAARLLAECESKRRMIARLNRAYGCPCVDILYDLALPYADHEDYREEWRH